MWSPFLILSNSLHSRFAMQLGIITVLFFPSINFIFSNLGILEAKLSDNFASSAPKLEDIQFIESKNKTVIIPNCIANLECKLIDKIKKGDHIIFICKILELQSNDKLKPLVYFNSKYF